MIDKLEKEIEKLYDDLNKMDFDKISKDKKEVWEIRLGAGASTYVSGPRLYGFLLGQWSVLKYLLNIIDRLRWEEKKKRRTNAFVFRSEYEYKEDE